MAGRSGIGASMPIRIWPAKVGFSAPGQLVRLAPSFCDLQSDPLDLVLGKAFLGAVVKLGCARALVRRHLLRVLERAAIGEVGGDTSRAEGVTADRRRNASCHGATADHPPRVRLAHRLVG